MKAIDDSPGAGVLILGAEGRIGRLLGHILSGARLAARTPTREGVVAVRDYADLPPKLFDGIDVAINCAGIVRGSPAQLMRVNAAMPIAAARAAQRSGVRRFVHVSSFSVYGHARAIDARTVEAPESAYGRSKAAGDAALRDLAGDGLDVVMLRLPAIIGPGCGGKTALLLDIWARTGIMAIPRDDVRRSMIGAKLTAQCLAALVRSGDTGVMHAADPLPFGYVSAARALEAATGQRFGTLAIPRSMTRLIARVAPAAAASLWADSLLDPAANLAIREGMHSTLHADLAAMVGRDEISER